MRRHTSVPLASMCEMKPWPQVQLKPVNVATHCSKKSGTRVCVCAYQRADQRETQHVSGRVW